MANNERYRKQVGQVKVRLTDAQLERLDTVIGDAEGGRAAFAREAVLKAIGWNEPPKKALPRKAAPKARKGKA